MQTIAVILFSLAPFFHQKDYGTTKNVRGRRKRCQSTEHWIFIPFLIVQNKFQMSTSHAEFYSPFALKTNLAFLWNPLTFYPGLLYHISHFLYCILLFFHSQIADAWTTETMPVSWLSSSAVFACMQLTLIFNVVHLPLYQTSSGPICHKTQTIFYFLAKSEILSPTICGTCYGEVR